MFSHMTMCVCVRYFCSRFFSKSVFIWGRNQPLAHISRCLVAGGASKILVFFWKWKWIDPLGERSHENTLQKTPQHIPPPYSGFHGLLFFIMSGRKFKQISYHLISMMSFSFQKFYCSLIFILVLGLFQMGQNAQNILQYFDVCWFFTSLSTSEFCFRPWPECARTNPPLFPRVSRRFSSVRARKWKFQFGSQPLVPRIRTFLFKK